MPAIWLLALLLVALTGFLLGLWVEAGWRIGSVLLLSCLGLLFATGALVAWTIRLNQRLRSQVRAGHHQLAQMSENEEHFRNLAQNARAAIGIVQNMRFVYANPYLAELSGYSLDEIIGMDVLRMVHPDFRPIIAEYARRREQGLDAPRTYEFKMLTRDGRTLWIDFSPGITTWQGKRAIIGAGFDVTGRKKAENALRRKEASVNQARQCAEADSRAKDQFLAVLSHELRTPLTPVVVAAGTLEHDPRLPEDLREEVRMIGRNVQLQARLIDDLLDLTRIARGKLEIRPQPVEVGDVVRHALSICLPDAQARQLKMSMELDGCDHWVHGDPARLQQVIWNLLTNSIKFTPPGGQIHVDCSTDDLGQTIIEVTDSGEGIDPQILPHIFNAFEQGGRDTTRRYGGMGLGLSISKALVELHGGRIDAFSAGKGQGSSFRVILPAAIRLPKPGVTSTAPSEPHPAAPVTGLHILLVEDHADTRRALARLLSAEGHQVRQTDTVKGALEDLAKDDCDLVICDISLPDGSGLEVMRELHARGRPTRGISLSGYGTDEHRQRSRQAGFSEHLVKPVQIEQLEESIGRVMAN